MVRAAAAALFGLLAAPILVVGGLATSPVTCNFWPSSEVQTIFTATDVPVILSQTDGPKLQLGVKFWVEVPGTITAFRYFKASKEPAVMRSGAIWPWNADRGAPAPNATTGLFEDSACAGGQWVRVPLSEPFSPEPHVQYAMAVDSITFYAQTTPYWPYPVETHKRDITVFGGIFGVIPGSFPGDFRNFASNYWIDFEFIPLGHVVPPPTAATPTANPTYPPSTTNPTYATPTVTPTAATPNATPTAATPTATPTAAIPTATPTAATPTAVPTYATPTAMPTYAMPTAAPTPSNCGTFPTDPCKEVFHEPAEMPALPDNNDGKELVLAVRVVPSVTGEAVAFRFYKPALEDDSHTLRIYRASTSELVRTVETRTNCSGPGWVSVALPQPLTLLGGVEYVFALENVRYYPKTEFYFPVSGGMPRRSLTFLGSVFDVVAGRFPTFTTFGRSNYFLDVEFSPADCSTTAPTATPTSATPTATPTSATPTATPTAATPTATPTAGTPTATPTAATPTAVPTYATPTAMPTYATPTAAPTPSNCGTFPTDPCKEVFHEPAEMPALPDNNDGKELVLAVRVVPSVTGEAVAFRFYKPALEDDSHTLRIYRASTSELVRTVETRTNCSGPGWVSVALPQPLTLLGGVEYVFALENVRYYPKTEFYFPVSGGVPRRSLTFLGSVFDVVAGRFPTFTTFGRSNYFLDVEFSPADCSTTAPTATPTSATPTATPTAATPTATPTYATPTATPTYATPTATPTAATPTATPTAATPTASTTPTAATPTATPTYATPTATPTAATPTATPTYATPTATPTAATPTATPTYATPTTTPTASTPTQAPTPGLTCNRFPATGDGLTLFTPTDLPAVADARDGHTLLVLGFRFTTTSTTDIYAIRFYQSPSEATGVATVSIYDARTHVRLTSTTATVTCTGGQWVEIPLPAVFRTVPNTQYIVAVDNVLYYPKTENFFSGPRTYGDVVVLEGVYAVTPGTIPTYGSASNYFIDFVYKPVVTTAPTATPTATPTVPPTPTSTATPTSTSTANPTTAPTFAPTLAPTAAPTVPLSQITCNTFPTATSVLTFFTAQELPQVASERDGMTRLVLGTRFTTSVAGRIRSFRFLKALYEASAIRSGRIYNTDTGALVAAVRFSDVGCAGGNWVVASLDTPFCTTAGTRYTIAVDDVLAYAKSEDYFPSQGLTRGSVTLIDGVYGFVSGAMPNEVFNRASNYWLDFEFSPGCPTPAPTAVPTTTPTTAPTTTQTPILSCGIFPSNSTTQTFFKPGELPTDPFNKDASKLVLATRVTPAVSGLMTSFRFYKSAMEYSKHTLRIYNPENQELLYSLELNDSYSLCEGPRWVSVPLPSAFNMQQGAQYVLAVEFVLAYPKTENFFPENGGIQRGDLIFLGSLFGFEEGRYPKETFLTTTNYWIDLEFVRGTGSAPSAAPTPSVTAAPTRNTVITCDTFPDIPGVQTIFESSETPYFLDRTDGGMPLVLGLRFETALQAEIHSFRFFKATSEEGAAHKARIYDWVTGQLLSEARFSDSFCPGPAWVDVPLSPPFTALPGIEYVIAIDSVVRYTLTRDYFTAGEPKIVGDLGVLGSVYGSEPGAMPTQLNRATSNYWIDFTFSFNDSPTPSPTATAPQPQPHSAISCGTFPQGDVQTFYTIKDHPGSVASRDEWTQLVLGQRFTTTVAGSITGFRFFKGRYEPGSEQTGRIYDAVTGDLLSIVTFTSLTCDGRQWISVQLATPLFTTAYKEYIVAIDTVLRYAKSEDFFRHPVTRENLRFFNSVIGFDSGVMPAEDFTGTSSYFVDVEFVPAYGHRKLESRDRKSKFLHRSRRITA